MDRKEFIQLVGANAGLMLISACFSRCSDNNAFPAPPTNVDFTVDTSTGALAQNGGSITNHGIIVARTLTGTFMAVSAACTHQGTTLQFQANNHRFYCFTHGSAFNELGAVTHGPASQSLRQYQTSLTGTSLRVFS